MENNKAYQVWHIDSWGNVGGRPIEEFTTEKEAIAYAKKKKKQYRYESYEVLYKGQRIY